MMNIDEYKNDLNLTAEAIKALKEYCDVIDDRVNLIHDAIKWFIGLSILSWCGCCFIIGYVVFFGSK